MLSLNSKHVQHVNIYLACNFKVNLITHLEVIARELKKDEKRAIPPRRVIRFTSKLQGMQILTS
jgi:hypothetical protein